MIKSILIVGPNRLTGGIPRFVVNLLGANIGYDMSSFNTARPSKPDTSKGAVGYHTLFAAGIPWMIRNVAITGWNILRFPLVLGFSNAMIVHITTSSHWSFWESSIYLIISKFFGYRAILHFLSDFQGFYGSARNLEKKLIQRVFKTADRVFVLSDSVRQIVASFKENREIVVLPSSVDIDGCSQYGTRKTKESNKITILFMGGNYGVRKGIHDLSVAIPRIAAECDSVEFWLCGGDDVQQAYSQLDDNFKNTVKYFGWVDEAQKQDLLSSASIYTLPSYSEGMPYGIIEAMAYGLPIVASNVGSIPEVVSNNKNGLLVSPGDIDSLVDSIVTLVRNPTMLHRIGKANIEEASNRYSSCKIFRTIKATYDELLK